MVKVTEADVYFTLSYHVWKTPLEIRDELKKRKELEGRLFSDQM